MSPILCREYIVPIQRSTTSACRSSIRRLGEQSEHVVLLNVDAGRFQNFDNVERVRRSRGCRHDLLESISAAEQGGEQISVSISIISQLLIDVQRIDGRTLNLVDFDGLCRPA